MVNDKSDFVDLSVLFERIYQNNYTEKIDDDLDVFIEPINFG